VERGEKEGLIFYRIVPLIRERIAVSWTPFLLWKRIRSVPGPHTEVNFMANFYSKNLDDVKNAIKSGKVFVVEINNKKSLFIVKKIVNHSVNKLGGAETIGGFFSTDFIETFHIFDTPNEALEFLNEKK
jgi:hypothetical protein